MTRLYKALLLLMLMPAFANEDELLPPEVAFQLTVEQNSDQSVELNWDISEGYYLYREKLKLTLNGVDYPHARLTLADGIKIEDALFGPVTIYKNNLNFSLPVAELSSGANLIVSSQGCYEPLGICYPPQTQQFNITTQARAQIEDNSSAAKTNIFSKGSVFISNATKDFLPVDEAFQLVVTATDPTRLIASFQAAAGYYLYKPHIKFSSSTKGIFIGSAEYPDGKMKTDPHYGDIEAYDGIATIALNLSRSVNDKHFSLTAQYQGCAVDGICYPPQTREIKLLLADYQPIQNDQLVGGSQKLEKSIFWYLLLAFGGGLLLTFTPCVLPMIPILSGIIMSKRGQGGIQNSGFLTFIYVMGTAASYTLIGAVAGATGNQLQAYFQTPWAIGFLSILLVIMALSMFGVFKLQVPGFMQTKLAMLSQKIAGAGIVAIFMMGMISALIVGACVSPLLISTLSIAMTRGSALLGAVLMFSMAMGMGSVLVLFGFGFKHFIPKVGVWMEQVNRLIGVLLLAVAVYLLSFVQAVPVLFLWSILLLGTGLYLLTVSLLNDKTALKVATKTFAVISITWGVLALIGAMNSYRDILNPLPINEIFKQNNANPGSVETKSLFTTVSTNNEIDALFEKAQTKNKILMLDYYADWCLDCLRMDGTTFKNPRIVALLNEKFISAKVDVTEAVSDDSKIVKKRFNVYGPPATLFFDSTGQALRDSSFYGYKNSEDFLLILKQLSTIN